MFFIYRLPIVNLFLKKNAWRRKIRVNPHPEFGDKCEHGHVANRLADRKKAMARRNRCLIPDWRLKTVLSKNGQAPPIAINRPRGARF